LETVRGIPSFGATCGCCWSTSAGWTLHNQGQSAARREVDATHPPRRQALHIISGLFYIGLGDEFDAEKLQAYPPGGVVILPGNTSHFHWAKSGDYITQVTAIGPLGLEYINAKDDPRNKS
jgi:hypothetical protein